VATNWFEVDPQRLAARPGTKQRSFPGELAAWVADMDFEPCPAVRAAIDAQLDTGDLGYPAWRLYTGGSPTSATFVARCRERYDWAIDEDDTREWCDVVQAVQALLYVCTDPGDGVVLHTPSYPPLWKSLASMGRRLVPVPAIADSDRWVFDHHALEQRVAADGRVRAILLCHPHNPTGHVFTEAELIQLATIAERHDLVIISDEIHADLTYAGVHIPMGSLAPSRSVTIHSASKTFNLAGLRYAISHTESAEVRQRIAALPDHILGAVNLMGAVAADAAWRDVSGWYEELVAHLDRNRHLLADLLDEHLPDVRYRLPEATYLAWLDCSTLGLGDDPAATFHERGVALSSGPDFGAGGNGYARLNLATSTERLTDIVRAMAPSR
jgi:cystathionine beta-lyase